MLRGTRTRERALESAELLAVPLDMVRPDTPARTRRLGLWAPRDEVELWWSTASERPDLVHPTADVGRTPLDGSTRRIELP